MYITRFRHFSVPRIPDVPGLSTFEGSVMHCHYYRQPETYAGQKVACVGGGVSGPDVAVDVSQQATKVNIITEWCIVSRL